MSPFAALSLVPSPSPGNCSSLALRDLGLLVGGWPGFASSLLSIHSTIGGVLMHLMQVRHRFSVSWWSFASMCSSGDCCLLTRRNHIVHVCPRSDCWHGKLFKNSSSCSFDTLSVSSHKSCANLIIILAIVTAAASGVAFPLHTTWSTISEGLHHVSSTSTQVVAQAHLHVR